MKKITKKWDTEKKRPVILLDYDDVLFDFLGTVIKEYNSIMGSNIQFDDIQSWDLSEAGDIHVFMDIIHDYKLWKKMPEKNKALKIVQSLINDGRWNIYICTSCTTLQEYIIKTEIIEDRLPGFDISKILNVTRKEIIRGDLIVDDKVENLNRCHPYMECILMNMPHNKDCEDYTRIHSLDELPKLLEQTFCY